MLAISLSGHKLYSQGINILERCKTDSEFVKIRNSLGYDTVPKCGYRVCRREFIISETVSSIRYAYIPVVHKVMITHTPKKAAKVCRVYTPAVIYNKQHKKIEYYTNGQMDSSNSYTIIKTKNNKQ